MTSTPLVGKSFFGINLTKLSARFSGLRRNVSKRVLLLEFDTAGLRLAEARFSGCGLQFDHVSFIGLPADALDRGVPVEPEKMGAMIQQLCSEKHISVHRSAVVLPTEVAFQHFIQLPSGLSLQEARDLVLSPSSGLQIPIALGQADFDLQITQLPLTQREDNTSWETYLITAIPSNLVDRVISTLQIADLELHVLEIGGFSQLRLMASDLLMLQQQNLRLVLELKVECTHLILIGASGPVHFERLAAIRDFPDPSLTEEQAISALQEGIHAEKICINDDGYLAISDIDLSVLISEVRNSLRRFGSEWSGFHLIDVVLLGRNSAHPLLPFLLKDEFCCPVKVCEPSLSPAIEGAKYDNLLVQKGLNRLFGLGLGLLPTEHLLSCRLPDKPIISQKDSSLPLCDITPDQERNTEILSWSDIDKVSSAANSDLDNSGTPSDQSYLRNDEIASSSNYSISRKVAIPLIDNHPVDFHDKGFITSQQRLIIDSSNDLSAAQPENQESRIGYDGKTLNQDHLNSENSETAADLVDKQKELPSIMESNINESEASGQSENPNDQPFDELWPSINDNLDKTTLRPKLDQFDIVVEDGQGSKDNLTLKTENTQQDFMSQEELVQEKQLLAGDRSHDMVVSPQLQEGEPQDDTSSEDLKPSVNLSIGELKFSDEQ